MQQEEESEQEEQVDLNKLSPEKRLVVEYELKLKEM